MANVPSQVSLNSTEFKRVINNEVEYLIQNASNSNKIEVFGSDVDLGLTADLNNKGYILGYFEAIDNNNLKNSPYVYARTIDGKSNILV